jgi:hypothetical protein
LSNKPRFITPKMRCRPENLPPYLLDGAFALDSAPATAWPLPTRWRNEPLS